MIQMNDRDAHIFNPCLVNIVTGERKSMFDNGEDNYESRT